MSTPDEKDYDDKLPTNGLQAHTGPADGSVPGKGYEGDLENGMGHGHEVRINGVRECNLMSAVWSDTDEQPCPENRMCRGP